MIVKDPFCSHYVRKSVSGGSSFFQSSLTSVVAVVLMIGLCGPVVWLEVGYLVEFLDADLRRTKIIIYYIP